MKRSILTQSLFKRVIRYAAMLLALVATAPAQNPAWQHAGSLYILTTPEGADLPATATEQDFPLLVRLSKETFDFSQAKANGEDIRFSNATPALARGLARR